ncbi:MAG: hypothetical protein M3121_06070 [Chloroflexota bacterium]|nr:hypothetical protein [Chloroflexota bacterium]
MSDKGRSNTAASLGSGRGGKGSGPSAMEWWVGGIATLLVLSAVGFLAYEAWRGTSLPPMIEVRLGQVLPLPERGYVVEFAAANTGGTTAQGVAIEGTLIDGGTTVETSGTTLQWVPAHAERQGGLFFQRDPRQHRLELRAKGYERP